MGYFAARAKEKEEELNKALGKKMVYTSTMPKAGASSGAPAVLPRASDVVTPKTASRTGVSKIGLAAEKASRFYAQNGPDMSVIKPKTSPADRYAMERAAPKPTIMERAKSANDKANNVYLQSTTLPRAAAVSPADRYIKERTYMPTYSAAERIKSANDRANNAYLKAAGQMPRAIDVAKKANNRANNAYLTATGQLPKAVSAVDKARAANDRANSAYLLRTEIMPTAARQGSGALDRVYNAISSIGDSKIGADMSLKAVAKQSAKNEAEYMKLLKESGEQIDALIQAREKYSPASKEYRKYNSKINQIYNKIDALRDRTADMTEANRFMSNAANLRAEATKGMGTAGRNLTEAAISVGDNLTTMALTGFNPAASLALMGVSAAGQRANELSNAGVSARDAFGRGAVSGVIEGLTEKIGMDNLMDIVAGRKTGVLANILKQAASEGAEEGIGSVLNYWADAAAGDRKSFDWNEAAQAVMQGMLSGFMFGVGGTVVNGVMPRAYGYSDMQHLNMAQELKDRQLNNVMPRAGEYAPRATDINNVNIGNMSAIEYLDNYNRALNGGKEVMMPRADEVNTLPKAEVPEQSNSTKSNEQARYMSQIYDVMTGNFDDMNVVEVGKTPEILQKYGASSRIMTMKPSTVRKIAYPTNYLGLKQGHNLGFYALEQLPKQLSNPVAIAESKTPNSLIVFTEFLDENKFPVMAAIHLDKNGNLGISNEIASVYGKREFNNLVNNLKESGKLLYEDKNRGLVSLPAYGLQLSEVEATTDPIFNIYNNSDGVNNFGEKILPRAIEENNNVLPRADATGTTETLPMANENALPEIRSMNSTDGKGNSSLGIVSPEIQQLFEASETAKKSLEKAYQFGVSGTAPFERMAKADTRENARNINALSNKYIQKGGIVNTLLTEALYDINGNKIDDRSFIQVASQVPESQKALFNDYWHELHNIYRQAQGKPVTKHTAEQSKEIVKNYEAQHPEFKEYLKNISDYYDLFIRTWEVDTGMIAEALYLKMKQMYPYYVPTLRVDDGVAGSGGYAQGKKIRNGNAIGKAKGGTQEVISFDEAFARKINSVVAAATKNDISREIFSFAQTMPAEAARNGILIETDKSNQYAGQMDIDDLMDSIDKNIAREISKGKYEITFYDNGKPQTMKINKDVWNAFNFLDDRVGSEGFRFFAGLGRKLTNPMRAMTTTYNPLFFLTNLMRDAQTYTINNTAKNSAYAMKNYVKALKGIVTKADTFKQYKALGGSQNGYYGKDIYANAERQVMPRAKTAGQKALGVLRSPLTAVEALGEFTEKIPRYAEYLNTIERLGNTDAGRLQASLNAADVTVNFNRSSTLSSLANAWVPYFNAGLQGMDKTFRQIKAHPIQTGARAAVSVFLPTLLLYIVNKDNPHWKDVKDGVRDNYYLIPNPNGPFDEDGNAETFIRLPKSREFGALFSASFERFIRAINESNESSKELREVLPTAFDGYLDTLLNSVMPNSVLDDNIFGAMKRLGTNTAWHGGKIVPSNLENVSPQYQYDINTSGAAMELAKTAGVMPMAPDWAKSPMKVDYLIDSYGGYAGDLLQGLTSRKNIGATDAETVKNSLYNGFIQPFKNRFNTDSAYSNYNLDRFYDMTDALEMAANDRNIAENLPPEYKTPEESVYSDFVSARGDITDITKQERAVLETPSSMAEKNRQIRELKKQKNEIAKDMMEAKDRLYEAYNEKYFPGVSVMPKYEAPDKITKQATQKRKKIDHSMTSNDKQEYLKKYSDIVKDEVPKLVESRYYLGLTTDEQQTALEYLYNYAEEQAKKEVVREYEISEKYNMKNIGIDDYKALLKKKKESEKKKKAGVIS